MIRFIKTEDLLVLEYQPGRNADETYVDRKLKAEGTVTIRKTFTFTANDRYYPDPDNQQGEPFDNDFERDDGTRWFVLGITEGEYFRVKRNVFGSKHDVFLWDEMPLTQKTFIAETDISIFRRIDALVDEPIVVGGSLENAIPIEAFEELLANFPTTTEIKHYSRARVTRVLRDYFATMSDAQIRLDEFVNQKKSIRNISKIEFISSYELKKFEYVRDELQEMLREVESAPNSIKEKDWQRQIVEFLLLIFPKYVAVLENVHIKDFYTTPGRTRNRYLDILLVDANGSVDVIEVKRPSAHQLLSRKPGSRGNYLPSSDLAEAAMQAEKYLFHMNKWGRVGERSIQNKRGKELPKGLTISITNPQAMLVLGRDKDFDSRQKHDFEIIKRKYANIVDIVTYDDLLRRLDNIITMIHHNYSKLGARAGQR
ncbi:MAG: DUF4263 domain-containing protein [Candidatus Thiodiazotropha lotti]|nr:DUF4263 domain-containing protein [Candidatus Thiodiazotropha lotti]